MQRVGRWLVTIAMLGLAALPGACNDESLPQDQEPQGQAGESSYEDYAVHIYAENDGKRRRLDSKARFSSARADSTSDVQSAPQAVSDTPLRTQTTVSPGGGGVSSDVGGGSVTMATLAELGTASHNPTKANGEGGVGRSREKVSVARR